MAAKIGIKLADGTFLPIMDDDSSASETLELTTVRDNQRSVQINLFKKEAEASEPLYIGSLIVEDIHEKPAGEPTVELQLALDEDKNLSAEAVDKDSGSHQALRVSLETFTDQAFDDLDFDLSSETADLDLSSMNMDTDNSFDTQEEFSAAAFYTDEDNEEEPKSKRGMPIWLLILLILLGIAALVLGILLLTKKNLAEDDRPPAVQPETAVVVQSEKPPMQEPSTPQSVPSLPADEPITEPPTPQPTAPVQPVQQEPAKQETPVQQKAPAVKEPAASVLAQKTVRYQLRWGDTLWDLSETYYRNPWLYTKIAAHNKLKNPDLIISGTYIEIPPQ